MMAKYRKKPVVIEAFRLDFDNVFPCWFKEALRTHEVELECAPDPKSCQIKTLEGVMTANAGDYIIRGVNGELYPCKADIFEKTYERVTDDV